MSNENKVKLADLQNVPDPGFSTYTLNCQPCVGVSAKNNKPYYFLKISLSRGEMVLSYDVFMRDNDLTALKMLGIVFPAIPVPVQVTGSAVITNG